MIYVLVANERAEQLSRSLMRLLRPSHLRGDDWTDLYCGVVRHPTNGQAAIELPETEQVPIHSDATGEELAALLQAFVSDGALTAAEASGIAAAVQANAGSRVRIADFIPPSWAANVLTAEQMQAAGWFAAPL